MYKFFSCIYNYLIPHRENAHKPHIFRKASVIVLIIVFLVLEGAYLAQIKLVFLNTDFLALVLPKTLIAFTNENRATNNLSTVTEDRLLTLAAQKAANDMATNSYFAHVSPDGKDPWYWLQLVGYTYEYAGQNLAIDFTDSDQVGKAWMNSPAHRANIVKSEYTKIGIGVANGKYEDKDTTFVVQFFATPKLAIPQKIKTAIESYGLPDREIEHKMIEVMPGATKVLGTQKDTVSTSSVKTVPLAIPVFFAKIATSPTQTILYILYVLVGIVAVFLMTAIFIKIRIQYLEVIAGGLILILVLVSLIYFNTTNEPKVRVLSSYQLIP